MALTRIQIVNLALDQSGLDTSFQAKARNWLNFIIQRLSLNQNYNFYRKSVDTPFVPLQSNYTLPADFQRADTIFFIDNSGNQGNGIYLTDSYKFDQYIRNGVGFPSYAYIDEEDGTLNFNSGPQQVDTQAFRFNYFRAPATLSLDSTDDSVVPDFKDQATLVEELKVMAFDYLDDERATVQRQIADRTTQKYQRLMNQADGNSMMDLNNFTFRATRRGYNRNGWGNQ